MRREPAGARGPRTNWSMQETSRRSRATGRLGVYVRSLHVRSLCPIVARSMRPAPACISVHPPRRPYVDLEYVTPVTARTPRRASPSLVGVHPAGVKQRRGTRERPSGALSRDCDRYDHSRCRSRERIQPSKQTSYDRIGPFRAKAEGLFPASPRYNWLLRAVRFRGHGNEGPRPLPSAGRRNRTTREEEPLRAVATRHPRTERGRATQSDAPVLDAVRPSCRSYVPYPHPRSAAGST